MNRLFKVSTLLVYAAITFTFTSCNDDDDNGGIDYNANVNKNIVTAANPELARLEFPKVKNGKSIILKYYSGDTYGLNYCVEWDTEKKSQRWSCYMMVDHHHSNYDKQHTYKGNAGRYDPNSNPGNHPNERHTHTTRNYRHNTDGATIYLCAPDMTTAIYARLPTVSIQKRQTIRLST